MRQNTQNGTYITIRKNKHNLKNETEAYKTYNHIYDTKWNQRI
jgi:hypothetical protein